ncbi:MAG: RICIN domain-containing protein [Polyangiaceae bacterium]
MKPVPTGLLRCAANDSYCIDAAQDGTAKRTPVRLFTCHGGENQRWRMTLDPNGSTSIAGVGGQCLDLQAEHPTDGAKVDLAPCTGGPRQLFTYDASGHLRDVTSGKCLTVTKAARGTPVVALPCDAGNPGQAWTFAE